MLKNEKNSTLKRETKPDTIKEAEPGVGATKEAKSNANSNAICANFF